MVKVCPVCGTENPDNADICNGCNIRLSSVLRTENGAKTDTEIDSLVKSILVKKESPSLEKKPEKREGQSIAAPTRKRELEIPVPVAKEAPKPEVETRFFRCPTCNAKMPETATRCTSCGTLFKYEPNAFNCPVCNTLLPGSAKTCPKCHAEFEEVVEPQPPAQPIPEPQKPCSPPAGKPPPPSQVIPETAPLAPPAPPPPATIPPAPPPQQVVASRVETPPRIYEEPIHVSFFAKHFVDLFIIFSLCVLIGIFAGFRLWLFTDFFWIGLTLLLVAGVICSSVVFIILNRTSTEIIAGDKLLQQKRYLEAIQHYDRAIKLGINLTVAWTNKGVALKKLGKYSEALACFNRAIQIDPKNEVAWTNKGDIYFKTGNYTEAIKCYQEAININPAYEIAWNNLGVANERIGAFKEAERCYDTAIKLKPNYRSAYLNKGDLLARTGRQGEAAQCYRNAGVM
ncbi:MAG: tetratricopeptide repeat protein [Thermoplasmata archaeon]